jgi:hypothetical protein
MARLAGRRKNFVFQQPVSAQNGALAKVRAGSDINSSQHMEAVVKTSRGASE